MSENAIENAPTSVPVLVRQIDWAASPLGAVEQWPVALRCAMDLMQHSESAMFLAWGEQRIFLYNQAYLPVLGAKHPQALGRPMEESWKEVWPEVAPLLQQTFEGKALRFEEHPFTILRDGKPEQAWFDFSYTPIYQDGQVGGVLSLVSETTRQVLAERALKEQAATLAQLFENAPGFMALLRGPEHVFELANQSYRDLIGGRNPLGLSVRAALPEISDQGFFELLDQVYRSGEGYVGRRVPVLLQHVAGADPGAGLQQRWVDFIYQPLLGPAGAVDGVFVQGADVTHHVETELALQAAAARAESERDRLNVLLDTVPTGIAMFDDKGTLLRANTGLCDIWGDYQSIEQIFDFNARKGWWADGTARHGKPVRADEWPIARALRGEPDCRGVFEIEPFGRSERRTILVAAAAIRDGTGKLAGALVAHTDLTEQVRTESAMRDNEAKFRVIANAIPHLVWSNLPDGTHDFYNDQWHAFTGLASIPDAEGWKQLVHPADLPLAAQRWTHSLATGEPYDIEYRLLHHPSQQYRWCLSRAVAIYDSNGRLTRWLGTSTDVHEQRMLTDELRRAADKKDEFLAMLAHELRNPLAPIRAASELLKIGHLDPQRQLKAATVIGRQVEHMTALVDDLLDVSRVTRGLVALELKPIDLKSVVGIAVEQAKPLIEARGHSLHVHIDAEHALVLADATRLVQVVVNLLSNAAKYTPQRGRLDVSVAVQDEWAGVMVQDNGSGIDPALLPHVFDIFTQGVRTPDRSEGGLGIGLALVKSLVAMHGGSVVAHSAGAGTGSRFEVRLPLLRQDGTEDTPTTPAAEADGKRTRRRILVVDDNVDAAETLAQLLEVLGNEVRVSFDGAGAMAAAAEFDPDTFVLDVGLPDMNGYELARRLQASTARAQALFIALTGYGQAHDRVLSQAAGFHHHFVKPVDVERLCEALKQA